MKDETIIMSPAMQLALDILKDVQKQTSETNTEIKVMNQKIETVHEKAMHAHSRLDAHEKEHKWVVHTLLKSVLSFIFGGSLIAFIAKFWRSMGG